MTTKPFQRIGSISNAHVGSDFETVALRFFNKGGCTLRSRFPLELGFSTKKVHHFDLGGDNPDKIIVECKSHRWTTGHKVPSAKMTTWNEAMLYFHLAPPDFRKVFFVLHHHCERRNESLLAYYKRTYAHLIPPGVEFMQWDDATGDVLAV